MGYIWKRDHDTRWRIAAKFVGHAFSDSFLSPSKTRIAYADADDKNIHVANLASGLMETFAAVTDQVRIYRKPVVAGWFTDDLLALSTGRHSAHHIGTLNLDSGITNWRQASGAFAVINGSVFCSRSFGIESYNPNLQRQSTIAVSSRGEAARIFPNGSFESNLDDPCELLFVVETPDGTSNTLTQPQFEDRFGRDAMVPSPAD